MKRQLMTAILGYAVAAGAAAQETPAPVKATLETSTWGINFQDFFREGGPLNLYLWRREGKWIAVAGSSRGPGGRFFPRYAGDMSGVVLEGETFKDTNWPSFTGIQEKNPAAVLPKYHRDSAYEYFVFRNRWQDKDDTVVMALLNSPGPAMKPRGVLVWSLGERLELPAPMNAPVRSVLAGQDRSAILNAENFSLAVDCSEASGADVLVVTTSSGKLPAKANPKIHMTSVQLGGTDC